MTRLTPTEEYELFENPDYLGWRVADAERSYEEWLAEQMRIHQEQLDHEEEREIDCAA